MESTAGLCCMFVEDCGTQRVQQQYQHQKQAYVGGNFFRERRETGYVSGPAFQDNRVRSGITGRLRVETLQLAHDSSLDVYHIRELTRPLDDPQRNGLGTPTA